jgi:hypothetical protein
VARLKPRPFQNRLCRQQSRLEQAAALEESVSDHAVVTREGTADLELSLPRQGVALVRKTER